MVFTINCDDWNDWDQVEENNEIHKDDDSSEEKIIKPVQKLINENKEKDDKENDASVIKECEDSCLFEVSKKSLYEKTSVNEACQLGCKQQQKSLSALQKIFQNTKPDLLVGNAIDKCWDGCQQIIDTSLQESCIIGCDKMKFIQRKMIKSGKMAIVEKFDKKENVNDKSDESKEVPPVKNEVNLQGADNEGKSFTYVLWSPGRSYFDAMQTYMNMMNIMDSMFQNIDTMDTDDSINDMKQGWKGDRRQLRIPARAAALTEDNDNFSKFYDQIAESLTNIKNKVEATVSTPGFQEYLFYILFCITGVMILQSLFGILFSSQEPQQTVDHFYLPPAGPLPPKLPTYDECMKDSQKLCVELTQQEEFCKVNLNLPLVSLPLEQANPEIEEEAVKNDNTEEKA